MIDREMLVRLIQDAVQGCGAYWAGLIADHLLDHGVTIREQGEWIFTKYAYTLECSVCKGHMSGGKTKYCPYCGSPMKGESNA